MQFGHFDFRTFDGTYVLDIVSKNGLSEQNYLANEKLRASNLENLETGAMFMKSHQGTFLVDEFIEFKLDQQRVLQLMAEAYRAFTEERSTHDGSEDEELVKQFEKNELQDTKTYK